MTEILYEHDESVVRESHEHDDIINPSHSGFIKESVVSFSPEPSFKKYLINIVFYSLALWKK